jgi:guanylate kinase
MAGKLFILSAPSGAGKTSLIKDVVRQIGSTYTIKRGITYTSRAPRAVEEDGYDYHFISPHDFRKRIQEGFFLEWSSVYTGYYGSPVTILQDLCKGTSYIMILDRRGAQNIRAHISDAILIWVYLVNMNVARNRLEARGTERSDEIARRMQIAEDEAQKEVDFPIYNYHLLHEDFTTTRNHLIKIIRSYVDPF